MDGKFELLHPSYQTHTEGEQIDIDRKAYLERLKGLTSKMNSKNTMMIGVVG